MAEFRIPETFFNSDALRSHIKTRTRPWANQYFTPKYTYQSNNAPPLATFPTSIIFLPVAKPSAKPHGLDGEGSLRRWFVRSGGLGWHWQVGMALAGRMVLALGLERAGWRSALFLVCRALLILLRPPRVGLGEGRAVRGPASWSSRRCLPLPPPSLPRHENSK